ncbi:MAG: DMT family transporter [Rhodobacteraceae bacterium]|nr:DMT family transporter [Paracoccaceae bacterium]MCY4249913.1 DMT family transporter [Paracoccaceae bacterium]MCY4308154.1 DMT family transporter [Paracoccaceae bacterium]
MVKPGTAALAAAAWMMGAVVSFSLMALSGREALIQLDTFELMLYRSLIGIIIVLTMGGIAGTLGQINLQNMKLHITRNLFHFAGQNLWFYALALIPFAQVFALEFSFPIWVALAAPLLLGEKLTKPRIFTAIVGFAGVLVVTRPGMATFDFGVLAGALCAIGFAGSYIYTKMLTRVTSVICILFWMSVIQAILGLMFAVLDGEIPIPELATMIWLVVITFTGLSAHYCITKALKLAPAIIVAPLDFLRLPLIAVIGMLFYGEIIDIFIITGAILIVCANYANVYWENKQQKRMLATNGK